MKVNNCYNTKKKKSEQPNLHFLIRDTLINNDAVFFGGYANSLYKKFGTKEKEEKTEYPNYDILFDEPMKLATIVKEELERNDVKQINITEHEKIGELIPFHVEVSVNKVPIVFIYKPVACHNYNEINYKNVTINVATIDTILSFYLAFYYSDLPQYNNDKLLCMASFLYNILEKNKFASSGIMKRYSLNCVGKQPTLKTMRAEKAVKFKELKHDRNSNEYEMWFLNYVPFKINNELKNSKEELLNQQEKIPSKQSKTKKVTKKKPKKTQKNVTSILKNIFKK